MESRRGFLRAICCGSLGSVAAYAVPATAAGGKKTSLTADQALEQLKSGNEQFLAAGGTRELGAERRVEIAKGQTPFAVFVSCSDSRVPPEYLFGRGLGELFVVRNAGNTVDTVALGSLEYAVAELGVPLVVIMGHERCGAVHAALSVVQENTKFPGSIGQMIEPIIPAVLSARAANVGAEEAALLDASVRANIERVAAYVREAGPILSTAVASGAVKVVGARYDLEDGKVEFFN